MKPIFYFRLPFLNRYFYGMTKKINISIFIAAICKHIFMKGIIEKWRGERITTWIC